MTGSWNVPSLYLDGYADSYGPRAYCPQCRSTWIRRRYGISRRLPRNALVGDRNPCVNGDYDDPDVPAAAFAAGKAAAMFGYSERLYLIRKSAPQDHFHVSSAPVGNGSHPVLFTDAFVLRKDCDQRCEAAARGSYLLPATLSAFETPEVRRDPYYRQLALEIESADPFPNFWIYKAHGDMRKKLMESLIQPD